MNHELNCYMTLDHRLNEKSVSGLKRFEDRALNYVDNCCSLKEYIMRQIAMNCSLCSEL